LLLRPRGCGGFTLTGACLLIVCPDRPGIVSAVSTFLYQRGANILDSAQHTTGPHDGTFFMRLEFRIDRVSEPPAALEDSFAREVAQFFSMQWRFSYLNERKQVGILVSRYDHCLLDLLSRSQRGELTADIVHVVSNHADLGAEVAAFGIPYTHIPVKKEHREVAERELLSVMRGRVDLLVLARYMQILSGALLEELGVPIINIHHSFLPAFTGAQPYKAALERGVKIIGATAHYVTELLDAGPIIEQDVERISHRRDLAELERIGRDIERRVLARAVSWHIDDRIIVHDNKTFVFD
jgi:formyltetrahydrofolate deformylase